MIVNTWLYVVLLCRVFSLKPFKGILSPNEHQIFVIKAQPKEVQTYKHKLVLNLNEMDKNKQVRVLWWHCDVMGVSLSL